MNLPFAPIALWCNLFQIDCKKPTRCWVRLESNRLTCRRGRLLTSQPIPIIHCQDAADSNFLALQSAEDAAAELHQICADGLADAAVCGVLEGILEWVIELRLALRCPSDPDVLCVLPRRLPQDYVRAPCRAQNPQGVNANPSAVPSAAMAIENQQRISEETDMSTTMRTYTYWQQLGVCCVLGRQAIVDCTERGPGPGPGPGPQSPQH